MKRLFHPGTSWLERSIFASVDIETATPIMRFEGKRISLDEALAKGDRTSDPVQVGANEYIDIAAPEVMLNHSCDPNAGLKSDLWLIALRTIRAGEQITFDYSTTMSEGMWTMKCQCRSSSCRGTVRDFHEIPIDRKRYYLGRKVVQQFIVEEIETEALSQTVRKVG